MPSLVPDYESSRQLAAIMFTDIVGYTAMMQVDEQQAVAVVRHYNASLDKWVPHFKGRVTNFYGDGSLCIFSSATDAVSCAIEIQKDLLNQPVVPLRIGLHIGEVFFEEGKAMGDGVNVASRVQSLGKENTILVSAEIQDKIKNNTSIGTVSLGYFEFKNVNKPLEIFALTNVGLSVPRRNKMEGKLKKYPFGQSVSPGVFRAVAIVTSVLLLIALISYLTVYIFSQQNQDKSIVVIPFIDLSQEHDQEFFSVGMMEEILNHLYKIGDLHVISRTTSMKYQNTKLSAREITRELGVTHILEGSVRKEGDLVRITVQLIDGEKDKREWSEEYNRPMLASQLLAVQSDVAIQVAKILKAKISPEVIQDIEKISTENTSAYTLYLKYKSLQWKVSSDSVKLMLDQVLAMDPNFAPALSGLGFYWMLQGSWNGNVSREQVIERALPLLTKALVLDSTLIDAHGVMARFHLWYKWDFASAQKEFAICARLNPNSFLGPGYYMFLHAIGRRSEMVQSAKKALELDRSDPVVWGVLAGAFKWNNQCSDALKTIEKAMDLFPNNGFEYDAREIKYECYGDPKAKNQFQMDFDRAYSKPESDIDPLHLSQMAIFYYKNGQGEKTRVILQKILNRTKISPVGSPSWRAAMIYAIMNEKELAFQFLEKSYNDHEVEMYWLKSSAAFELLHSDPRWGKLIAKMKYPS